MDRKDLKLNDEGRNSHAAIYAINNDRDNLRLSSISKQTNEDDEGVEE